MLQLRYINLKGVEMKKILFSLLCLTVYTFSTTFEVRVNNDQNDAEEFISSGNMYRDSTDLELVFDDNTKQMVGIRFKNILLPSNAIITNAYIQFTVDEIDTGLTEVIVVGEDTDDASKYKKNTNSNISSRAETTANVLWNIPAWSTVGLSGVNQRTGDLSSIVTEIYSRAGWVSGNSMAFMIKAGVGCTSSTCQRTAESYKGSSSNAPLLHIEYTIPLNTNLLVDYRMDECYWLGGAGGVIGDVRDSSGNGFHATSESTATIIENTAIPTLCNYGKFSVKPDKVQADSSTVGNTNGGLTVAFWIKADEAFPKWANIISKTRTYYWSDGWGFVNRGGTSTQLSFFINRYSQNYTDVTIDASEGWVHIVGTYDTQTIRLYKNSIEIDSLNYNNTIDNASEPLKLAFDGDYDDGVLIGSLDEVKIWDRALNATDIATIYNNESTGKNFDGTARVCPTCDANVTAGIWELIGIPANLNTIPTTDVATLFDEFPLASYNQLANIDGWTVYQREYNSSTNASAYTVIPYTGTNLKFGQGYWLISKVDQAWNANSLLSTDYNSTHSACVTQTCVEIDLTSVNKNFAAPDNDVNDGSGKNRNNMLGFVGQSPVDWADCRILVDGVAYTPSGAEIAGYAQKQVWQYNPSVNGSNANGYTTCDDVTPGGCKLEPYKGFWLILHGTTKNKTLKLLIPKE
jgi:hypothetical protein